MKYAIIKSGGKQIKVEPGMPIWVEKLDAEEGTLVKFTELKAVYDGKELTIGTPSLTGEVTGKVEKQGKHKKVKIFRTKEKSNWDREIGHRQPYTRVLIEEIILDGKSIEKAEGRKIEAKAKVIPKTKVEETTKTSKPKVEEKVEETKTEVKVEETKTEVKVDKPKVEEVKVEETKVEAKVEETKVEAEVKTTEEK